MRDGYRPFVNEYRPTSKNGRVMRSRGQRVERGAYNAQERRTYRSTYEGEGRTNHEIYENARTWK